MFDAVMKLLNRNRKTSKEIAKDRLKVVLIHDRANISPEIMQAIKKFLQTESLIVKLMMP